MNKIEKILYLNKIAKSSEKKLTKIKLQCQAKELSPSTSTETIKYHYDNLYDSYVKKSNQGVGGDFQRAGAFLHEIYFGQLNKYKKANEPSGLISDLIKVEFSNFQNMKKEIKDVAMKIQGSGWVYVSKDGKIKTIKNHEIKSDILILIDWWEHAWALDYQSDKESYLDNFWQILDWNIINDRL